MKTGRERIEDIKKLLKDNKIDYDKSYLKDIEDDLDELDELRDLTDIIVDFEYFVKIFKDRIELFSCVEEGIPTYAFIIGFNVHYVSKEEYEIMEKLIKVVK